jgi:hypothetical protein
MAEEQSRIGRVSILIFPEGTAVGEELSLTSQIETTALAAVLRYHLHTWRAKLVHSVTHDSPIAVETNKYLQLGLGQYLRRESSSFFGDLFLASERLTLPGYQAAIKLCLEVHGKVTPRAMAAMLLSLEPQVQMDLREHIRLTAEYLKTIARQICGAAPEGYHAAALVVANRFAYLESARRYLNGERRGHLFFSLSQDVLQEREAWRLVFDGNTQEMKLVGSEIVKFPIFKEPNPSS